MATGILALTACGGGGGGGGGGSESRGDITIWYSNNASEIAWGEQMVEAWNADHPDEQVRAQRSEEHTSELQSLMRISYAVFCLKKKKVIKCDIDANNKK